MVSTINIPISSIDFNNVHYRIFPCGTEWSLESDVAFSCLTNLVFFNQEYFHQLSFLAFLTLAFFWWVQYQQQQKRSVLCFGFVCFLMVRYSGYTSQAGILHKWHWTIFRTPTIKILKYKDSFSVPRSIWCVHQYFASK